MLVVGAVFVPAGVVAAAGTGLTLTGTAISLVASLVEGFIERRKVKTIQEQLETLKEYISGYALYSDMTETWFMAVEVRRKVTDSIREVYTAVNEVSAMGATRFASKAGCLQVNKILLVSTVGACLLTLYSLYTEVKDLYKDEPTQVIKHLRVLKSELEHITRGCRY